MIGIIACVEGSIAGRNNSAVALFPFNGPSHGKISLDVAKKYQFKATYDDQKDKYRSLALVFDTPGSTEQRKTSIIWEGSLAPIYSRLKLESVIRNAAAEIGLNDNDSELSLYAKANDGTDEFLATIGFKKSGSETRKEYTPIVVYKTPKQVEHNALGYTVEGKIVVDKSKAPTTRYEFNGIRVISSDKSIVPVELQGHLERVELSKFDIDVTVSQKPRSATLQGKLNLNPEQGDVDLDASLTTNEISDYANGKIELELKRSDKQVCE